MQGNMESTETPGGVLPKKLDRGVRPASQNPYPIYYQNLRLSLPYIYDLTLKSISCFRPAL